MKHVSLKYCKMGFEQKAFIKNDVNNMGNVIVMVGLH